MADNRFERRLSKQGGLAAEMADASRSARRMLPAPTADEEAIRDVAAGVAAPVLVGYVLWLLERARALGLKQLCFLSRDAQVLFEIAEVMVPCTGFQGEIRYVYSSRRTWSLAASDPHRLDAADWMFDSFTRSNAADVCAVLGLDPEAVSKLLARAGVSPDQDVRADSAEQNAALRRFVALPEVAAAVSPRIAHMRELVRDYAQQEGMAKADTGLVDAGWTGRMVGSLHAVLADDGLSIPHVFFWGHEPLVSGGVDRALLHPYMYSTSGEPGVRWRVPGNPYIIETFCMSDHSIVSGYTRTGDARVAAELDETNAAVSNWGLAVYRAAVRAFCLGLQLPGASAVEDIRPVLSAVLRDFWTAPTLAEAGAWGAYPYDSDPVGRSTLPLARPISAEMLASAGEPTFSWGDHAWLQGSLALSGEPGRRAAAVLAERYEQLGGSALGMTRSTQG